MNLKRLPASIAASSHSDQAGNREISLFHVERQPAKVALSRKLRPAGNSGWTATLVKSEVEISPGTAEEGRNSRKQPPGCQIKANGPRFGKPIPVAWNENGADIVWETRT